MIAGAVLDSTTLYKRKKDASRHHARLPVRDGRLSEMLARHGNPRHGLGVSDFRSLSWTTGHAELDRLLRRAVAGWERLALQTDLTASDQLNALPPGPIGPDAGVPPNWAATYYMMPPADQVLLAFAWLHWWQQSSAQEPGFAGWLVRGPGLSLNHAALLKVLTQQSDGVLGVLHGFLNTIVEQAGDWDGDRTERPDLVCLLTGLDAEYRYTVHDRELWPAVLDLAQTD